MSLIHKNRFIPPVNPDDFDGTEIDYHQDLWAVPWRQLGFDYCCVYLITPENYWPVKIGISENAAARLNTLQTAHWSQLQIPRFWLCENKAAARRVEVSAHITLRESARGMLGEWFDVKLDKAAEIVEFAGKKHGIELATRLPETEKFHNVRKHMQAFYDARVRVLDKERDEKEKKQDRRLTDLASMGHNVNKMRRGVNGSHHHPVCNYQLSKNPTDCTCGRSMPRRPGFDKLAAEFDLLREARRKRA